MSRLLDVERAADLGGGNAVLIGELRQQRELARGNFVRAHRIVIDARDDSRELTHPRRDTRLGGCISNRADVERNLTAGRGHVVHRVPSRLVRMMSLFSVAMIRAVSATNAGRFGAGIVRGRTTRAVQGGANV